MATQAAPADITKLDAIRARLRNLSGALQTLTVDLQSGNSLLPWPYLYDSFNHITRELHQLTEYLNEHRSFLDSVHAYPLPSFPGVEQEPLLAQLLRRKLDPEIEAWVEGDRPDVHTAGNANRLNADTKTLAPTEQRQLWSSAAQVSEKILSEMPKGLDYTLSELVNGIENVETGIRRELRAGEEKIVIEEDDTTEDAQPGMLLEDVMKFMTRGEVPRFGGMGPLR